MQAVELYKTLHKTKTNDIRKYNMKIIEEILNIDTSMKITRTLGVDRKQLFILKDEQDQITK